MKPIGAYDLYAATGYGFHHTQTPDIKEYITYKMLHRQQPAADTTYARRAW